MDEYAELIRNAGQLIVGLKQVLYHVNAGKCTTVILASDTDREFKQKVQSACAAKSCRVVAAPSGHELGMLSGIAVSAGVVGVL